MYNVRKIGRFKDSIKNEDIIFTVTQYKVCAFRLTVTVKENGFDDASSNFGRGCLLFNLRKTHPSGFLSLS